LIHYMAIWNILRTFLDILWPFGTFLLIWYTALVPCRYQKNLATLLHTVWPSHRCLKKKMCLYNFFWPLNGWRPGSLVVPTYITTIAVSVSYKWTFVKNVTDKVFWPVGPIRSYWCM
jgi:hypothetical protein